jgi:hypothetical protein
MRVLRALPALLFGLMLAGGGLFFLSQMSLPMWQDWQAMRSWQPAYAQLQSVSGSENETKALYRYEVDGVSYNGDRVYISTSNDNIGPYHKNLLAELRHHRRIGEPVQVWVDPQDPGQAVIDRDMRWGLFALMGAFCSVLILIGFLVAYAGIRAANKKSGPGRPSLTALRREWRQKSNDPNFNMSFLEYAQQRAEQYQQQTKDAAAQLDWHLRKGWGTATIRSEAKSGLIAIWGFAILWNAISWPLVMVLPKELAKENYPALFVLLFPLAGLILLYQALRKLHEYRRFGVVQFEMDPYPGSIGRHVGGHVQVSRLDYGTATVPGSKLLVRLECVYFYISGSGKNRSRRESIKWAEEGAPHIESSIQGVRLSFHFNVP